MKSALAVILLAVSAFSQTDGPATLPQRTPSIAIVASNDPKIVGPHDSLQLAIKGAVCGDTFLLDPTGVYEGAFAVPSLPCDAQHGIIIKNSFAVTEDANHRVKRGEQLPKIVLKGTPISGGTFVLWYGIEITRDTGSGTIYALMAPGAGAHHQVFDHMYIHGTLTDETVRGIDLSGGTHDVVIQNSVVTDFHCRALGTCGDAQAILGGINDGPDSGSYLIQNNLLEGSGENIMFGGGGNKNTPCDITIRQNDFNKPDTWNPLEPLYAGQKWIVKNLLEFKNACRVLVEGNRMTGSWGGFTQQGYGILVGAKNQNGNAAAATVSDITIRNNWISKTGLAMAVFIAPSLPAFWPKDEGRISIHDNIFDQLQYPTCYQCGQWLIELASGVGAPIALHDVSITNNTLALSSWFQENSGFMNIGGNLIPPKMENVNVTNNIFPGGRYPIYSTGGRTNCAYGPVFDYAGMLSRCNIGFTGNTVLINGTATTITWPAGNNILKSGADVVGTQKVVNKPYALP